MRREICTYLDSREEEMFALLGQLVCQPSPSRYKEGVDAVGAMLVAALHDCHGTWEISRQEHYGDHLLFRSAAWNRHRPSILLFGHMDTVFPMDSPFSGCHDDGVIVRGPGVIDMKGGLVSAIFAVKALDHLGLLDTIPLVLLCNSDEEIGSPTSTELFYREARGSCLALGFECGGLQGEVATGRKGRRGYTLTVHGRAGHAAFAGPDKASAILELSHKIIALEQLNDPQKSIVVNVGTIIGGIGANTVAARAIAEIDTRFLTSRDAIDTARRIDAIVEKRTVDGTGAEVVTSGERFPMEQTAANAELYGVIAEEARLLNLPCRAELRSGVSDANTIAQAAIAVVDGLGPVGAGDHSEREYMMRESLPARSKLAACSIIAAWQRFHPEQLHGAAAAAPRREKMP